MSADEANALPPDLHANAANRRSRNQLILLAGVWLVGTMLLNFWWSTHPDPVAPPPAATGTPPARHRRRPLPPREAKQRPEAPPGAAGTP